MITARGSADCRATGDVTYNTPPNESAFGTNDTANPAPDIEEL